VYIVQYTNQARQQLLRLDARTSTRIYSAIARLAAEPRPPGVKKLRFADSLYRIRVRDYRVIYEVRDKELVVAVVRVTKRDEAAYRGL
jgi:mRNA interferase RelE/StbE